MTSVPYHIETSQLIYRAYQLTGFYMMGNTGCYCIKNKNYTWCLTCKLFVVTISSKHLFKINNRNTRKRYEICSKLTKTTPNFEHFFSNDSIVDFKQVYVAWVFVSLEVSVLKIKAL